MRRIGGIVPILALVLAACTAESTTTTGATETTTDTSAAAEKTIIIGTTDAIASLDPADAYSIHDWELIKNTSEGLLKWMPGELELTTGLATEMPEVSDDGLTYTVTLRDGITFSDGTELTAPVYAEQLTRLLTIGPDCPNGVANALATPFIESVEAPDDTTLVFTLTRAVAYFPELLASAPFVPAHPGTFPAEECVPFPEAPVHGVGPFYITEYTQGEQTVLERNPNYTGEFAPKVDRIIVRYFSDPQTMALAAEDGEIDVAWRLLGPELIGQLEEVEGLNVGAIEGGAIRFLVLNYAMAPMDDVNVRKAVAAAIDRDEIADVVYGGNVEPLYSPVPPGFVGANEAFDALYGSPDLEAARGYLAESGYTEESKLALELWYPPEHYGESTADWMALIETQLEATGVIDVTLQAQEWSTYVSALTGGEAYPAGVLGWFFDYPDSSNYLEPFVLNGGLGTSVTDADNNPVDEQAAELLAVLDEASTETDPDIRADLYAQAQDIYAELVVTLPLFFEAEHVVFPDNVTGDPEAASPETLNIGPNLEFNYSLLDKTE